MLAMAKHIVYKFIRQNNEVSSCVNGTSKNINNKEKKYKTRNKIINPYLTLIISCNFTELSSNSLDRT